MTARLTPGLPPPLATRRGGRGQVQTALLPEVQWEVKFEDTGPADSDSDDGGTGAPG